MSVIHALTGDGRLLEAFRTSVRQTMSEMEADMEARVRRDGQEHDRPTGNMVYSEFVHLTSRPVDGLPCPQMHLHCFVANATYDVAEAKWKAGQFGRIKGDGYYWQAVQQARFAAAVQKLGYGVRRTKDAFEIEGLPEAALQAFSLRTKLIERVAAKLGITDPKAKARLAATTREAKLDGIPYPELVARWEKRIDADAYDAVRATRGEPRRVPADDAAHVGFAAAHEFERASVIDERRLLATALRHGLGDVTPEGVRAEADRLGLLKRTEAGKCWVTTPAVLQEETGMLRFAVAGKGSCPALAGPGDEWRDRLRRSILSPEQQAAVSHLLTSADRVMILPRRRRVRQDDVDEERRRRDDRPRHARGRRGPDGQGGRGPAGRRVRRGRHAGPAAGRPEDAGEGEGRRHLGRRGGSRLDQGHGPAVRTGRTARRPRRVGG